MRQCHRVLWAPQTRDLWSMHSSCSYMWTTRDTNPVQLFEHCRGRHAQGRSATVETCLLLNRTCIANQEYLMGDNFCVVALVAQGQEAHKLLPVNLVAQRRSVRELCNNAVEHQTRPSLLASHSLMRRLRRSPGRGIPNSAHFCRNEAIR